MILKKYRTLRLKTHTIVYKRVKIPSKTNKAVLCGSLCGFGLKMCSNIIDGRYSYHSRCWVTYINIDLLKPLYNYFTYLPLKIR